MPTQPRWTEAERFAEQGDDVKNFSGPVIPFRERFEEVYSYAAIGSTAGRRGMGWNGAIDEIFSEIGLEHVLSKGARRLEMIARTAGMMGRDIYPEDYAIMAEIMEDVAHKLIRAAQELRDSSKEGSPKVNAKFPPIK